MPKMFGERTALVTIGPRIMFDRPVPWELFERPGPRAMLRAISLEAPQTVDGVIVITSTIRDPDGPFSWHWSADALDVRTGCFDAMAKARGAIIAPTYDDRVRLAGEWAARVRNRLGLEYDVIFGDERHIDHMHLEHDGGKASRRFEPVLVRT